MTATKKTESFGENGGVPPLKVVMMHWKVLLGVSLSVSGRLSMRKGMFFKV